MESGLCRLCNRDDGFLYVDVAIERDDRTTTQIPKTTESDLEIDGDAVDADKQGIHLAEIDPVLRQPTSETPKAKVDTNGATPEFDTVSVQMVAKPHEVFDIPEIVNVVLQSPVATGIAKKFEPIPDRIDKPVSAFFDLQGAKKPIEHMTTASFQLSSNRVENNVKVTAFTVAPQIAPSDKVASASQQTKPSVTIENMQSNYHAIDSKDVSFGTSQNNVQATVTLDPIQNETSQPRDMILTQASHDTVPQKVATHPVVRQIVQTLPKTPPKHAVQYDVDLNPKDLGHVKISLRPLDTSITVHVSCDVDTTAQLVRRNIDQLTEDLSKLGYTNVNVDLGQSRQQRSDDGETSTTKPSTFTVEQHETPQPVTQQNASTHSIDIRI